MSKVVVLEKIKELGLLAVIRGPSPDLTIKMVAALVDGGVSGIEITYSTPNAEDVVSTLSRTFGSRILLGMGTLTRPEQAQSARDAGASFLVSPVSDPDLVRSMVDSGLLTMVGAFTPTEVFQAYNMGADVIKIFPGSLGGPAYVRALKGPLPHIPIMPTGGVNASNLADWFSTGVVAVGAGSKLCPPHLAMEGKFDQITERAAEFVKLVQTARA